MQISRYIRQLNGASFDFFAVLPRVGSFLHFKLASDSASVRTFFFSNLTRK